MSSIAFPLYFTGYSARCRVVKASVDPVSRRTVARPVTLAQASQSRLGEMTGIRLEPFLRERSPKRPARLLSERVPHPGERGLA
ncbi:hypothetical protein DEO72_LG4g575 [Vigna unguiculata]|uniref:Uncharacterized protein n=1 Tax=Vigna unguiculata TaxID=3917 RepID=A0A4D6LLH5_VIGUN|nr:hypothetical protein DEO72_LG4g575 [Vigna unguiculata]